jgi:hypothetical protein
MAEDSKRVRDMVEDILNAAGGVTKAGALATSSGGSGATSA